MSKYIDAEWLKDNLLDRSFNEFCKNGGYPTSYSLIDFIEILNYSPAADVVEVVRCKDCQYAKPHNDEFWIEEAPLLCELFEIYVSDNDYCSMGERKDG